MPLFPLNAEFARPLWVFGMNSYEVIQSERKTLIACSYRKRGMSHLVIIDILLSSLSSLDIPFMDIQDIVTFNDEKSEVIDFQIIWSSSPDTLKYDSYFSLPELIEFPTEVPGQNAYAYFYPLSNQFYQASQEVESRKVDGNRICITGVSAGGYTTLATLAFRETFRAGASLYGKSLHRSCISCTTVSEKDCYERSPINSVEKFSCPIILFQVEDKVVLPDQACKIYGALKQKGLPVALVEYEGEQHGFRKAENIKFTLEQQMLFFVGLVGRFDVVDDITPVKIDNFD
ncbi:hypothetical protein NL676_025003 [Syzygium grande]|nr:hypothetical protein NL676_025003 [Syzygium grande]